MKVDKLADELGLKLLVGKSGLANEVTGCYICDLLSYVMGRASKGDAWITVQTNINVIAVAVLTEVGCVIVPEDIEVDEKTLAKAELEGIAVLSSSRSAYELACAIKALISV